jgi:hypothetical protein
MPGESFEQAGVTDAAYQVLGMRVEQLRAVLSDPGFKNPLGLSVSEAAAHIAFFAELLAIHAPMALYSFLSPLFGNLDLTYGAEGIGSSQPPVGVSSPLGPPPSMGTPLSGQSISIS